MAVDNNTAISRGIAGRCPECGEGKLFDGYLEYADSCEACGADFAVEDAGDGPAFFVMSIVSIVVVPMAIAFHFATGASMWVTMAIWMPVLILASLILLRPMRGIMFNLQWVNAAREVTPDDLKR